MSEIPLSDVDEAHVQSALAALETADGLVPGEAFPALQTDALRAVVVRRLAGLGRVLLVREHHGISGFTSGYDDTVGERLAAEGIGVLPPLDRAVLILVLLRTVAAPRARGVHGSATWLADGSGTSVEELYANPFFTYEQLRPAVRRLKSRRLLREGFHRALLPGPALLRLTDAQSARLWEDLVLVTQPDSMYARAIRLRRHEQTQPDPSFAPREIAP
ncbi:hypothetical protein PV733_46965 [Streptomyces europaeiscabiei]|uniref:hypothetical protein n=1 Tax=Streptomyces europaeiscabiei TaxID=146819 RepID=UPI0029AB826B|nr:hypothetical protein [Streptomyces europaeiscabiei]MDX3716293.1 hypothetical protein [Streptomyces europaeiscabiei]